MKITLILLLAISAKADKSWFDIKEPPMRWSPPVMRNLMDTNVKENWISVPVDHFDKNNNSTFKFRYLSSDKYTTENGSILIMVGGEWSINESFLGYGTMFEIAKDVGARMLYTEHRYYGTSTPVEDLSTKNLKYLSVDQALSDLAHLIRTLKKEQPKSKIVLFGGSYAGNMVVWFCQKYPNLVDGAVASSGPVLALRNFWGYMQVVHDSILEEGGEECVSVLTKAVQELREEMSSEEGRKRIAVAYSLCELPNPENQLDIQYFYAVIAWGFGGLVQTAKPGNIAKECRKITSEELGPTPFDRLAKYIAGDPSSVICRERDFQIMLDVYGNTEVDNESRLWYYQTCTEFGYYQTSPNTTSIFDGLLSIEFYEEVCKKAFSDEFTSEFIEDSVSRTNTNHGGMTPKVRNLISVYGLQDPWHALGVRENLGPTSPTFLVPKASHCFDLYGASHLDTTEMANTKKKIADIVKSWIQDE